MVVVVEENKVVGDVFARAVNCVEVHGWERYPAIFYLSDHSSDWLA